MPPTTSCRSSRRTRRPPSTIAASASTATVDRMFSRSIMMRVAYTRRSRPSASFALRERAGRDHRCRRAIATGVFVPAGSFALHSTLPVLVSSAQTVPSNVVVKTTSLVTVAAPYGELGELVLPDDLAGRLVERDDLAGALARSHRACARLVLSLNVVGRLLTAAYTFVPSEASCDSTPPRMPGIDRARRLELRLRPCERQLAVVVMAVVLADRRLPEQLAGVLVDRDDDAGLAAVDRRRSCRWPWSGSASSACPSR